MFVLEYLMLRCCYTLSQLGNKCSLMSIYDTDLTVTVDKLVKGTILLIEM